MNQYRITLPVRAGGYRAGTVLGSRIERTPGERQGDMLIQIFGGNGDLVYVGHASPDNPLLVELMAPVKTSIRLTDGGGAA